MKEKIVKLKDINKILKLKGKKVLVGGCFDLLHIGHVRLLKEAKKRGDLLIVALESDKHIKVRKKKTSLHTQGERAEILASLQYVDSVIVLPYLASYNEYLELVRRIAPQIIAVTAGDPQYKNKLRQAQAVGATVKVVTPHITGKTTTLFKGY